MLNCAINSLYHPLDIDKRFSHLIISVTIVRATASVSERHGDRKRTTLFNQFISRRDQRPYRICFFCHLILSA